jgi:hypothetical protein
MVVEKIDYLKCMKTILKLEEIAQLALAAYLAMQLPYAGWIYWALFLTPDISMLGYLVNTRLGALAYNLFHHKGVAIALYLFGLVAISPLWQLVGLLLFGHSAFDRIFGYGLKYSDNFKNTQLGWIGKQ